MIGALLTHRSARCPVSAVSTPGGVGGLDTGRIDALNTANEIRTLRAQLKRDLKAGRTSIAALRRGDIAAAKIGVY